PNRGPHPYFKTTNSSMWPGQQPVPQAHITDSSSGILGPAPSQFMPHSYGTLDQPTSIPRAFNATTLRYADNNDDSGWYMDTGATSHL
ncbi:hypothetical protein Tco_0114385, partial [Tanacetum coccineum]